MYKLYKIGTNRYAIEIGPSEKYDLCIINKLGQIEMCNKEFLREKLTETEYGWMTEFNRLYGKDPLKLLPEGKDCFLDAYTILTMLKEGRYVEKGIELYD